MAISRKSLKGSDNFESRISGYSETFLSCRDLGHRWHPVTATHEKGGNIRRTLGCDGCGATRNQTLDKFGYIISSNYGYQAGYLIPGAGRLTAAHRALIRIANIINLKN